MRAVSRPTCAGDATRQSAPGTYVAPESRTACCGGPGADSARAQTGVSRPRPARADSGSFMPRQMPPAGMIFVGLLWAVPLLVYRYPVDGRRPVRAVAIHTAAALLFPVIHLGALALAQALNGEPLTTQRVVILIAYYYIRGVVLYGL